MLLLAIRSRIRVELNSECSSRAQRGAYAILAGETKRSPTEATRDVYPILIQRMIRQTILQVSGKEVDNELKALGGHRVRQDDVFREGEIRTRHHSPYETLLVCCSSLMIGRKCMQMAEAFEVSNRHTWGHG